MKKLLFILLTTAAFTSCDNEQKKVELEQKLLGKLDGNITNVSSSNNIGIVKKGQYTFRITNNELIVNHKYENFSEDRSTDLSYSDEERIFIKNIVKVDTQAMVANWTGPIDFIIKGNAENSVRNFTQYSGDRKDESFHGAIVIPVKNNHDQNLDEELSKLFDQLRKLQPKD